MCGLKSQVIQQQGCYHICAQQIAFIHHRIFLLFFTKYYINAQAVNKLTNSKSQSTRAVNKPTSLNTLGQLLKSQHAAKSSGSQ